MPANNTTPSNPVHDVTVMLDTIQEFTTTKGTHIVSIPCTGLAPSIFRNGKKYILSVYNGELSYTAFGKTAKTESSEQKPY